MERNVSLAAFFIAVLACVPVRAVPIMGKDIEQAVKGFKEKAADTKRESESEKAGDARKADTADAKIYDADLAFTDPIAFMDENEPWAIASVYGLPTFERSRLSNRTDAPVRIDVSISRQSLTVKTAAGVEHYAISSGVRGHSTPTGGCYDPDFLDPFHRSSLYNNAPMPHAIFFNGNIAVHATYDEAHLGQPASHGCVRLSQAHAAKLYALVQRVGIQNTLICVSR